MSSENITMVLFFVGDNKENAFAGLAFDDYDDAVECALDNGFSQVWEAEFNIDKFYSSITPFNIVFMIDPSNVQLIRELEY